MKLGEYEQNIGLKYGGPPIALRAEEVFQRERLNFSGGNLASASLAARTISGLPSAWAARAAGAVGLPPFWGSRASCAFGAFQGFAMAAKLAVHAGEVGPAELVAGVNLHGLREALGAFGRLFQRVEQKRGEIVPGFEIIFVQRERAVIRRLCLHVPSE